VREERPDLEKQKNHLVLSMAADNKQLKDLEDKILRLLSTSEGNILDNETLINTLSDSKITSGVIQRRVKEAEETEKEINETRLTYTPAAVRGSILYFVIADLANIDPMYQFSLEYFTNLFHVCISKSIKSDVLETRLANIMEYASLNIYRNVSRGLFGEHKTIYAFLLTTSIMRARGEISPAQWMTLLTGAGVFDEAALPKCPDGLEVVQWAQVVHMANKLPGEGFAGFDDEIKQNSAAWIHALEVAEPHKAALPGDWDARLDAFGRLLVTRVFRVEKLVLACADFVAEKMGVEYMENPPLNLHEVFPDSTKATPLVFVLSTGADPMSTILRFAAERNYDTRTHSISLGQGQGPVADKLIQEACRSGDWVVLSNCHLAKSWMPKLEKVVEAFPNSYDIHDDFRLWLTSMPVSYFPVPVLQNSIKMTFEPPKGIRANLKGTWATVTDVMWDSCTKPRLWHKLLFGITFFHAVVQERRKFGPLGWNIRYEFNTTDLEVSMETLRMFLDEQEEIPWDALLYVSGQIHYGGRVTDDWDRRCLMCILRKYYSAQILEDAYFFDESGEYFAPDHSDMDEGVGAVRKYVEGLPTQDGVGLFGLHHNARITFETQETLKLLDTITALQPRTGGGAGGESPEEMVSALCEKLEGDMPVKLDREEAGLTTFEPNEKGDLDSLQIVLLHEMSRFNKLLARVKQTLIDLRKAIKGLVVMSGELDSMFGSMLINKVPLLWEKVSFLSLKPLSSWVKDLQSRVAFFRTWLVQGRPVCFAMPAFFFPQGFMTGALQLHARKYAIPIDTLNFSFDVLLEETLEEVQEAPEDGVKISGFFMDGARYDRETRMVADSLPKVMTDTVPVIHFKPTENYKRNTADYECPLYKTAVRAGVLSTTGQSTNFVIAVDLPTDRDPNYWVRMGAALLCALSD